MKYTIIPNVIAIVDSNLTRNNATSMNADNYRKQFMVVKEIMNSPNKRSTIQNNVNNSDTIINQQVLGVGKKVHLDFKNTIPNLGGSPNYNFDWKGQMNATNVDVDYPNMYSDGTNIVVATNTDQKPTVGVLESYPTMFTVNLPNISSSMHNYESIGCVSTTAADQTSYFFNASYNSESEDTTISQTSEFMTTTPTFENSADNIINEQSGNAMPSVSSLNVYEGFGLDPDPTMTQTAFILVRDSAVEIEYSQNSQDLTVEYYYLVVNNSTTQGTKHYKLILTHEQISGDYIAKWERTETSFKKDNNQSGFLGFTSKLCEDLYEVHGTGDRQVKDNSGAIHDVGMNKGNYFKHKPLSLTSDLVQAVSLPTILLITDDGDIKSVIYHNKTNERSGMDASNSIPGAADYNLRNVLSSGTANPKIDYTEENFIKMLKQIGYKQDTTNYAMGESPNITTDMNNSMVDKSKYGSGENQFFKPGKYYAACSYNIAKGSWRTPSNASHPQNGGWIGMSLGVCLGPIVGMTPAEDLIAFNYTLKDGSNTYNTNTSCISATRQYLSYHTYWTDFADWHASTYYAYGADKSSTRVAVAKQNPSNKFATSLEVFPSFCLVPARTKVTINSSDGNVYSIENVTTSFENITDEYNITVTGKLPTPGAGQNPDEGNHGSDSSVTIPNYESGSNNYIKW